jgi:hypothetical protein
MFLPQSYSHSKIEGWIGQDNLKNAAAMSGNEFQTANELQY